MDDRLIIINDRTLGLDTDMSRIGRKQQISRTLAVAAVAALSAVAVVAGPGTASAAPASPVIPQIQQGYAPGVGNYTITMLTKSQTRDLWNAGIPQAGGDWFEAQTAFSRALSPDGAGCVVFGQYSGNNTVTFTFIRTNGEVARSGSSFAKFFNETNFTCV